MPPLETLWAFLAQGGIFGGIIWWIRNTHRDAIRAHERRADAWEAAANAHEARADDLLKQLLHVYGAFKSTTGAP